MAFQKTSRAAWIYFVGNGGSGMILNDSDTVTLHPTKIDATPTSNAEYSFDIFVGGARHHLSLPDLKIGLAWTGGENPW